MIKLRWWEICLKCDGFGEIGEPGRFLGQDELTDQELAERAVLGGWARETVLVTCPSCDGTRMNKFARWVWTQHCA